MGMAKKRGGDKAEFNSGSLVPTAGLPGRTLVAVAGGLFLLSTAFPVVASLTPADRVSTLAGVIDVGLAFVLVLLGAWIEGRGGARIDDRTRRASHQAYRVVTSLPLVLLVTFFVVPHAFRWEVLLPGLAWRVWLLCFSLPAACALWMGALPAASAAIDRETR